MLSDNIIIQLEQILTKKYLHFADETVEAINYCDSLGETLTTLDKHPDNEFYIRILQLLRLFFNSEFMLQNNRISKALKSYQKLQSAFTETQSRFPDLYSRWQYDIDRIILRIDARTQDLKAQIAMSENDLTQAEILLVETINRYSNELQLEQDKGDYDHYFDSLGLIFQTTGFFYQIRGSNSRTREDLYQAHRNLKKAKFLGQPILDSTLEKIREDINSLTIAKLEGHAESLFNQGSVQSESEFFDKAKVNFQKSAQFYRSLRRIHNIFEYELQEQIQFSSYYEAMAKNFMAQDDNEQAALYFSHATQTLNKVTQQLPSESLKENFEPQIIYFESMHLFCQAVTEYDKLIPEAVDHFNEAQEKLENAKAKADASHNAPLVKNCVEALNKLHSYQEIAGLMFQPDAN
ncbi:MAG: hypothetical protein ACXAC8_15575 [Candidatus Hodarchaeales archaeon]